MKKKITVDIYFLSFLIYKGHFSPSFQKSELKFFYLLYLWEMLETRTGFYVCACVCVWAVVSYLLTF